MAKVLVLFFNSNNIYNNQQKLTRKLCGKKISFVLEIAICFYRLFEIFKTIDRWGGVGVVNMCL